MKILMEKQYNLQEVFENIAPLSDWKNPYSFDFGARLQGLLNDMYSSDEGLNPDLISFAEFDSEHDEFTLKDYVDKCVNELFARYFKYYAISIEEDSQLQTAINEFIWKFFNVLNVTYPKYSLIIKALKDNETKLMSGLSRDYTDDGDSSGTVTSRYNDTPQDGGAFDDDNHTTNINESASSSESSLEHKEEYNNEYMIDRINKIRDNLSNIFTEWENKVATILWR